MIIILSGNQTLHETRGDSDATHALTKCVATYELHGWAEVATAAHLETWVELATAHAS